MPQSCPVTKVAPMKNAMNEHRDAEPDHPAVHLLVLHLGDGQAVRLGQVQLGHHRPMSVDLRSCAHFHSSCWDRAPLAPVVTKSVQCIDVVFFAWFLGMFVAVVTKSALKCFLADYAKLHRLQVSGTSANVHVDAPAASRRDGSDRAAGAARTEEATDARVDRERRRSSSSGQRGYHATTVADIAAAADVSERTVFTYFPTKEDILFSDHAVFRDRLARALAERPAGASALDTLRDFVVENLSAIDESSRVRWEIVSNDEHLLSHQRARHVELGDTIAAAVADELGEDADDFRLQLVTAA